MWLSLLDYKDFEGKDYVPVSFVLNVWCLVGPEEIFIEYIKPALISSWLDVVALRRKIPAQY